MVNSQNRKTNHGQRDCLRIKKSDRIFHPVKKLYKHSSSHTLPQGSDFGAGQTPYSSRHSSGGQQDPIRMQTTSIYQVSVALVQRQEKPKPTRRDSENQQHSFTPILTALTPVSEEVGPKKHSCQRKSEVAPPTSTQNGPLQE